MLSVIQMGKTWIHKNLFTKKVLCSVGTIIYVHLQKVDVESNILHPQTDKGSDHF